MNIDRVIDIVRQYKLDEEMTTGSTAGAPGFSGSADPAGPVAGYDPVMEPPKKKKKGRKHIKSPRRKPWLDYLKKKK
jgi:hypothetical protein